MDLDFFELSPQDLDDINSDGMENLDLLVQGAFDDNIQLGHNGHLSVGGGGVHSHMDSPHTPPMNGLDSSGRVGSTPVATQVHNHVHTQLPESPPDSQPAYSPLGEAHGMAMPGRDLIYPGLPPMPPMQHQNNMLQTDVSQYASPPQQQHHFTAPQADVRIKHESGLIINPGNLLCQQQQQQMQHHQLNEQQFASHQQHQDGILQDPMLYYDNGAGAGMYASGSYQNLSTCTLTSALGLGDRVHVIGTSQLSLNRVSAPSTPVHSLSRKRKMSTQLDCPEFPNSSKVDAGLQMSPLRASHHSLATPTPAPSHCSASVSPALSAVNSQADNSLDGQPGGVATGAGSGSGSGSEAGDPAGGQCIRFNGFQPENWHKLFDQSLQELSVIYYRVDADKGFNFSVSDDAYVCQKKNHFQVTCHARLQGDAKFVKTPSGFEKIKSFHLHFYGVKFEAPNQTIRVEQSQSDRSKKAFHPVPIDLQKHIVSKITVGRLHFSETTNNNMRKKGRPNPEQRFFQLVVGLHVHTISGNFPVVSHGSEKIIVRASNPGQFESDVDLCWQRGLTPESVFHTGRVGINTDRPDESLVVHGNLKVSGHIVQPSDSRAKQEIGELDTSVQLRNLQKIRIVRYRYMPEFAVHSGLRRESDIREIEDTGVIAQEVREVIPDAVQEAGSVVLPNGNVIENFLLVNKDRILMENIGAVKELCKVTCSLESRIEHLERANVGQNSQQLRAKDLLEPRCILPERGAIKTFSSRRDGYEVCSSRSLQIVIFLLIIVMAACLAAVSTLYFVEHNKQQQMDGYQAFGNGLFRPETGSTHLSDEERHYFHNLHTLFKNKTHGPWPSRMYATSTARPPGSRPAEEEAEDLAAVLTKPQVVISQQQQQSLKHGIITTTAPRFSNKTINSKKGKWPPTQEVLRQAAGQKLHLPSPVHVVPAAPIKALLPAVINDTVASTEKPPQSIPLPQDFENNSIDIDAQQKQSQIKLDEHIVVVGTIASPASDAYDSNSSGAAAHPIRKFNSGTVYTHVYKTVSPPTANLALTTNKVSTESAQSPLTQALDVPPPALPLRNSSDNPDALDLQNLSNTNESVDNPITGVYGFEYSASGLRESNVGRRSANQRSLDWIRQKNIKTAVFGQPAECNGDESVSDNCQSVCFEELPPTQQQPDNVDANVKDQHVEDDLQSAEEQDQDPDIIDTQPSAPAVNETSAALETQSGYLGKSSHSTDAMAKKFSQETESVNAAKDDPVYRLVQAASAQDQGPKTDETVLPPFQLDCWSVSSCVLAAQYNNTIDVEQFCPTSGSSLNVSYIVPVSRYLQASSLELHLSSNKPLQWSICIDDDQAKPSANTQLNEDDEATAASGVKILKQEGKNKLSLALDLPARGYFLRDFMLRASQDLEQQKLCDDNAHLANPILQYNFRIVRDCD
ncbi:myelin regulatory factor isoform X1 [Drosophila eugracilis]|uniref:myelin regulatory factor isoform X1 n=1 Tax=Drosophila eugracilis TaxID=29029 RepID=UPI0007E7F7A4|nr:myelin regulatory factor isoform X1 [Drosophila eugracilis]